MKNTQLRKFLYARHLSCATLIWALLFATAVVADDRSYDGTGNNVANPSWGAAGAAYNRIAPAAYGDGVSTPAGNARPGPREVSNGVGAQNGAVPNNRRLSGFVYAFGQLLNHEVELTRLGSELLPIRMPPDDPFFSGAFLPLPRSVYDGGTGTGIDNPREQINSNTAFIDASAVYGSDSARANQLRATSATGLSAKLATGVNNTLPRNSVVSVEMDNGGFQSPVNLYSTGDTRANDNVALASLHTLFVREHNRLVDELSAMQPDWTDEQLYQRARKIVGAQLQVITFQEFLPALLGPYAPSPHGVYDPSIDPTITNEFATLFLRVGHSMLSPHFRRIQDDGSPDQRDPVALGTTGFSVVPLLGSRNGLDVHLKGLSIEPQAEVDTLVDNGLRNIFGGIDLFAIDIQRGRDHGLADYNSMRESYGLPTVSSFAEISSDPQLQMKLLELYGSVDDIDPIIGMLAEDHLPGASVGALVAAGFDEQFARLRDGDRYWYENDGDFTSEEIAILQGTRLSEIIQRNTGLTTLQKNVFVVPEPLSLWLLSLGLVLGGLHFRRQSGGSGGQNSEPYSAEVAPPRAVRDHANCAKVHRPLSRSEIGNLQRWTRPK